MSTFPQFILAKTKACVIYNLNTHTSMKKLGRCTQLS